MKTPKGFKESLWHTLIAYGGAIVPIRARQCAFYDDREQPTEEEILEAAERYNGYFSFFGGRLETNLDRTVEAVLEVEEHGIDYEKSTDPTRTIGSGFIHTFTESTDQLHALTGVLITNSGRQFPWGVRCPEDFGFGETVELLANNMTLKEALEHIYPRIENEYFNYTCELPKKAE